MKDSNDLDDAGLQAIHDSIALMHDFSQRFVSHFRNNPPGARKCFETAYRCNDPFNEQIGIVGGVARHI
jgi:hypothetical protein